MNLFVRRQKEWILRALSLEQKVQQGKHAEKIISSALQVLKEKNTKAKKHFGCVYEYADKLQAIAEKRMKEIEDVLNKQLSGVTPPQRKKNPYQAHLSLADGNSPQKHYFYNQIVEVARKFDYFANLDRYRAWIRISIRTEENFEFVVSFHGYGYGDTGIMAVSAFTDRRVEKEEGGAEPIGVQPASIDLFQFNYAEPFDSTAERFRDWLEGALAIALGEWKRLIAA